MANDEIPSWDDLEKIQNMDLKKIESYDKLHSRKTKQKIHQLNHSWALKIILILIISYFISVFLSDWANDESIKEDFMGTIVPIISLVLGYIMKTKE